MRTLLFVALLIAFVGCRKNDIARGTPQCIEDKIQEFSRSSSCDDVLVKEYKFQGKAVYAFEPGTCGADMTTEVLDSDCKTLGHLGGFAGNTKINGEDFSSAKFVRVTWKK